MKPTQQEIIELAREARLMSHIPFPSDSLVAVALSRFATLLLERFSAGDGEPFGYFCDWGDHDGLQRIAMYYGEPGSATFDDWNEYPKVHKNLPLYTHPSPTDLRAEYLRGLEDAAKVADANATDARTRHAKFRCVNIAEAIRTLKGK